MAVQLKKILFLSIELQAYKLRTGLDRDARDKYDKIFDVFVGGVANEKRSLPSSVALFLYACVCLILISSCLSSASNR